MTTPVFGLCGWSGSGKTTLLVELIELLSGRGLTVSTVKHAHHSFDVDRPGKFTKCSVASPVDAVPWQRIFFLAFSPLFRCDR